MVELEYSGIDSDFSTDSRTHNNIQKFKLFKDFGGIAIPLTTKVVEYPCYNIL